MIGSHRKASTYDIMSQSNSGVHTIEFADKPTCGQPIRGLVYLQTGKLVDYSIHAKCLT